MCDQKDSPVLGVFGASPAEDVRFVGQIGVYRTVAGRRSDIGPGGEHTRAILQCQRDGPVSIHPGQLAIFQHNTSY